MTRSTLFTNTVWLICGLFSNALCEQKSLLLRNLSDVPNIPTLSRSICEQELGVKLCAAPEGCALAVFPYPPRPGDDNAFLFLSDAGWNRILFMDILHSVAFGDSTLFVDDISSFISQTDKDTLRSPQGIACDNDPDGDTYVGIYIADRDRNRIMKKKMQRNKRNDGITEYWVSPYIGYVLWLGLNKPVDVEFSSNGTPSDSSDDYLWVVDQGNNRLLRCKIDGSGTVLTTYSGDGSNSFLSPTGIAAARDFQNPSADLKKIYVSDAGNHRVVELSSTTNWATINWRVLYNGDPQSNFTALDVDPHGFVWVVDHTNQQVIKINPTEPYWASEVVRLSGTEAGPGPFNGLHSIASVHGNRLTPDLMVTEHWSDNSGGRWYRIGVDIIDSIGSYTPQGQCNSLVDIYYTVTDPGFTNLNVYRKLNSGGSWTLIDNTSFQNRAVIEGQDHIVWTIPCSDYNQPYTYKFEVATRSTYVNNSGVPVNADTVNLLIQPMWESGGSAPVLSVTTGHATNRLTWADPFIAESGYYVHRKPADSLNWKLIAITDADIRYYSDEHCKLIFGTQDYDYRVRAFDLPSKSPWSNVAVATRLYRPDKGDANGDGELTPADVVVLLECAFIGGLNCNLCVLDVNCDDSVSPADVVLHLMMTFLGGQPSC